MNIQTKYRRLLAVLAAWALLAVLAVPARAEDAEIQATVTISTGVQGGQAEVAAPWDDGWFTEEAGTYRHELALVSMALSGAAYLGGKDTGIQAALRQLGFGNITAYHYQRPAESADATAYTFAVKKLPGGGRLAAIVVRGTGQATEWTSNLNMGPGGEHTGFAGARDELLGNLRSYLAGLGLDGEAGRDLKYLITGHSRGGAVANLTAARLSDEGEVYAYTFASPTVASGGEGKIYPHIFNIVNEEDLVTQVPLAGWGWYRYGVDLLLPAEERLGEEDYAALFDKMDRRYTGMTGQPYARYQNTKAVEEMTCAIQGMLPSVSAGGTAMLSALLRGDLDGLAGLVEENSLLALALGRRMLALSSDLTPLMQQEARGMVSAHCMAGYYSWLSVCGEEAEALFQAASAST